VLVVHCVNCLVAACTFGQLDSWTAGQSGQLGSLDSWTVGQSGQLDSLDIWAVWTVGHLDSWTVGQLDSPVLVYLGCEL
jgi:hypothetical protein